MYLGVGRVFNDFPNQLGLAFVVVGFGNGIDHVNGRLGHVGVPVVILAEDIEAVVGLGLADVADDLVDDVVAIFLAGHRGTGGRALALHLPELSHGNRLLLRVPPLETKPLGEAFGGHVW